MDADLKQCFSSTVTPAVEYRLLFLPSGQTEDRDSSVQRGEVGVSSQWPLLPAEKFVRHKLTVHVRESTPALRSPNCADREKIIILKIEINKKNKKIMNAAPEVLATAK